MSRITLDNQMLDISLVCARRGTCLRRNYGAVVVDSHRTVVSTGYTGPPRGFPHCETCWRQLNNIPSGTAYDKCRSVHAEANALLQAGKAARGCTMYLAGLEVGDPERIVPAAPCYMCAKLIVNAGIDRLVILHPDGILLDVCSRSGTLQKFLKDIETRSMK